MSDDGGRVVPAKGTKRGSGKLPLRNIDLATASEDQSSRSRPSAPTQKSPSKASDAGEGGLQFINLLGTEKHDTDGRNTVRSHARRHAWKNQKRVQDRKETSTAKNITTHRPHGASAKPGQSSRTVSEPNLQDSQEYIDQCSRFREVARLLPQRASTYPSHTGEYASQQTSPTILPSLMGSVHSTTHQPLLGQPSIANGHSDPFNAFPIPLSPRLHHLIHYSRGVQNIVNETTTSLFFNQMGNSPSLTYATLAWTTSVSGNMQPRSSESEYYLHMSIAAINEDLKQASQNGIADGTIAAVACLSNMENLIGDRMKAQIHLNGLQQMIASRGGINALGINGLLRRLVLWADVLSATRWQTIPRFHLSQFPDLLSLPPLEHFRPPLAPKAHFAVVNPALVDAINKTANQALFHTMRETYDLAHFLDTTPSDDPGLLERASFPDRIYIVEYKILLLIADNEKHHTPDSIVMPLLLGLLLYIYTNVRLTPIEGQIRLVLISRLQNCLQQCDMSTLNREFSHEMRWLHYLGGGAAQTGTPERAWYVRSLVDSGCRKGWLLWDHIVLGLKGFETAFLQRCEGYWHEVEEVLRREGHMDGRHGPLCFEDRDLINEVACEVV